MVTKQSNTVSKQFVLLRCPCLQMFVSAEPRRGQPIWTPTAPLSRFTEAISRRTCINAYRFWQRWRRWKRGREGWGEGWGSAGLGAGTRVEAQAPNLQLVRWDTQRSLWTREKVVGKRVEKTVLLGSRSKTGIGKRASPAGTTRGSVGRGCIWREMLCIPQREQREWIFLNNHESFQPTYFFLKISDSLLITEKAVLWFSSAYLSLVSLKFLF